MKLTKKNLIYITKLGFTIKKTNIKISKINKLALETLESFSP